MKPMFGTHLIPDASGWSAFDEMHLVSMCTAKSLCSYFCMIVGYDEWEINMDMLMVPKRI